MFDCVIDLMVNLGYQMVEDCLCYSFNVCWAMQVGMSVFQKWRKARMKQMRLARSSELSRVWQDQHGSNTPGSLCGGGVLGFIPMSHISIDFKISF